MRLLILCAAAGLVLAQNNTGLSNGVDTIINPASGSCVCDSDIVEDPNHIHIAGIFDLTSYDWGYDVFTVTVDLINQGFWPGVKEDNQIVREDLANADCSETKAVRSYWDLRTSNNNRPMHGIIGARCSGASTSLARIADLERVPIVSPSSNSARLSNDDEFPSFSRLVAPDNEIGEVGAFVALLRHFGWERVTILATDTLYAKDLVTEFRKIWVGPHDDASGSWFGNVAYSDTIRLLPNDQVDKDSVRQALDGVPTEDPTINSRIILLVAHNDHAFEILQQANSQQFQPDTVWVGPSAWVGRNLPGFDFDWLSLSGYLGVAPFRNRDETYDVFLRELQDYQLQNGKEVITELPPFAAEFVDSIRAMVTAISANTPNFRDGDAIVKTLRGLRFDGVSGFVEFTEQGDRKNPQYSVINSQGVAADGPYWADVGTVGTVVGSADIDLVDICFAVAGCRLDEWPEDSYPVPPAKLPGWVVALIVIFPLLLIGVGFKYWRSRRAKHILKQEVEVFRKSIVGMRTASCDYIPKIGQSKDTVTKDQDMEWALRALRGSAPPIPTVQWCWKETAERVSTHNPSHVYGDPKDCWIKYGKSSSELLEKALQNGDTECSPLAGYKVNLITMVQTKTLTSFNRPVLRVLESPVAQDDNNEPKKIDLDTLQVGDMLPKELEGEPQMVLVTGDIVQISTERDDGWAFGTKLHHTDEVAARQLVIVATAGKSGEADEDANVFPDTGWFPKDVTHIPSSDELAALQKKVHADGLDPPSHWAPLSDASVVQTHEIPKGDKEYTAVMDAFMSTLKKPSFKQKVNIVKVERIQNLAMYQSYVVKRQTICYRETNGDSDEEVQRKARERFERSWLWHGCSYEVVDKILQQGFNRSFCGKNATFYGKGVYFARDASYSSHPLYSAPDDAGHQHIMACRVVVGEYCRGKQDALTPDIRDPASQSLYDSTVGTASDPMSDPSVFVTYHDAQAYPEYLITFKTGYF